jgi:SpoVK/Ycf46/Vps4 family AAA+-type ATPase
MTPDFLQDSDNSDFLTTIEETVEKADPFPAKARRERVSAEMTTMAELECSDLIASELVNDLVDSDHRYAEWLRVVMLRVLLRTSALGKLKGRHCYNLNKTCEFLGFENFEDFAEKRSLYEIQTTLTRVLLRREKKLGSGCHFPANLQKNLRELAAIIGLDSLEQDILGLAILIHAESVLEPCCDLLGSDLTAVNLPRFLGPVLGEKPATIAKCLQRSEKLATSGLLMVDMSDRFGLRQLLDLLTSSFAARMLMPLQDVRTILDAFVRPAPAPQLQMQDYAHLGTSLEICMSLLKKCKEPSMNAVNILIYGKPGTGKTEFSRLLALELGMQLMEINAASLSGAPVMPMRRLRNYSTAQSFFQNMPSVLLFDECDEVLQFNSTIEGESDKPSLPRKSWVNQILETNKVPTLWVANNIERFDDAYLRRFSVCIEMPMPSGSQREKMLQNAFADTISAKVQARMALSKDASPAMLTKTAQVLDLIAADKTVEVRDEMALHLLNGALKAQRKPEVLNRIGVGLADTGFAPQWVNCDVDLQMVAASLADSRAGRMCLWGPPGTGKTAFGKWIAQMLGAPHMIVKASELLSAFHGETEQKMARAFEEARQQKAVLQFDEVDSFLQDRSKATRQWEVTQVNEMLTQMENFEGIFIASTNLFDNLDEASLRRFDMAIKFDFVKPDVAWEMFVKACDIMGVVNVQDVHPQALAMLRNLTPGDFEQLVRRARLLKPSNAQQVLRHLQSAVALKKSGSSRPIGFLMAA